MEAHTVRVVAVPPNWAEALMAGDDVFVKRFGVQVVAGWAGFPDAVARLASSTSGPVPAEWGSHLVFDADGALVGLAGWKGAPVGGAAELGYAVAPGRQGRGIASAAVRELLVRAQRAGLRLAVAHTLAAESASTSVLRRCGFTRVAVAVDDEDGPVWRWERSLESDAPRTPS